MYKASSPCPMPAAITYKRIHACTQPFLIYTHKYELDSLFTHKNTN